MANIYESIVKTMSDIGYVGKNDQNQFDKYRYRGIDAVMNALNPAMIKNRIFVIPEVLTHKQEERTSRKGELMIYTVVSVRYTFYAEDGSSVQAVVMGEAMDRSDKSTNKAMSAAFKYACFQTFCIPTEEMRDADAESPEVIPKPAPEAKVRAMRTYLSENGIPEQWICAKYNSKTVEDMSEDVLDQIARNMKKIKGIYERELTQGA